MGGRQCPAVLEVECDSTTTAATTNIRAATLAATAPAQQLRSCAVAVRRAFASSSGRAAFSSDACSIGDDTSSVDSSVVVESVQYVSGCIASVFAQYEAHVEQQQRAAAAAAALVEVVSQSPVEAVFTALKASGLTTRVFPSLHACVSVFE